MPWCEHVEDYSHWEKNVIHTIFPKGLISKIYILLLYSDFLIYLQLFCDI